MLSGIQAPTPLGNELAKRPPNGGMRFAEMKTVLPTATATSLHLFVQRNQITVYTMMQAAWALLLSRYSGHEDVLFGMIVSGRPPELRAVETMVGLFVNTLPVRVQVSDGASILPWLRRLQHSMASARQYEFSQLVEIQACSEIPRGLPLFNSILAFANYPSQRTGPGNSTSLRIGELRSVERTNYALTVGVIPGEEIMFKIIYDSDRFASPIVSKMLEHFIRVIEEMIDPDHQQIGQIRFDRADQEIQLNPLLGGRVADELEQFNF